MHTLVIVNPGHFHAGLILRRRHSDLSRDVYIHSEAGTDLDNYMKLVNAFNERAEDPTDWIYHVYTGSDFLAKAVEAARAGIVDIAVFARRNDEKVYYLEAIIWHQASFLLHRHFLNNNRVKLYLSLYLKRPVPTYNPDYMFSTNH